MHLELKIGAAYKWVLLFLLAAGTSPCGVAGRHNNVSLSFRGQSMGDRHGFQPDDRTHHPVPRNEDGQSVILSTSCVKCQLLN
jgi:hypothetical protein